MMGLRHSRVILYLSAILGAREIEAWGRLPLRRKNISLGLLTKTM